MQGEMMSIDTYISDHNKLLGSTKYGMWRFKVQIILEREHLWEFVENIASDPLIGSISMQDHDPRDTNLIQKLKKQALSIMRMLVQDNIVPFILNIPCPKESWENM